MLTTLSASQEAKSDTRNGVSDIRWTKDKIEVSSISTHSSSVSGLQDKQRARKNTFLYTYFEQFLFFFVFKIDFLD